MPGIRSGILADMKPFQVQIFQHVPFEGPAQMETGLEKAGGILSRTRWFLGEQPPPMDTCDFLLILGGPMSVNDEAGTSWLVEEKEAIRAALKTGIPMLGLCLGAQLIAEVLGGKITRNPEPEIGWFPVEGLPQTEEHVFSFPPEFIAFHWHGETFSLPPGVHHLARSKACENQAFQAGRNIIGLQFHLETTPEAAQALVTHARDEMVKAPFVQTERKILTPPAGTYPAAHRLLNELVSFLLSAGRSNS